MHRTVFDVNERKDRIGCVGDGSAALALAEIRSNNLIISQSLKNIQNANKCDWVCKGIKDLVYISVNVMKTPRMTKKVHEDCPFTREQIIEMKAMLYNVNTSHHCCNPAPVHWGVAAQEYEQLQAIKGSKERYKEWLENELRKLET